MYHYSYHYYYYYYYYYYCCCCCCCCCCYSHLTIFLTFRRAQVANWILYFKKELWGKSLEQLLAQKDTVIQVKVVVEGGVEPPTTTAALTSSYLVVLIMNDGMVGHKGR